MQSYQRIDGGGTTFAIGWTTTGAPRLLHFGPRLPPGIDLRELDNALARGPRESTPDVPIQASLFPAAGFGWMAEPAVSGIHVDGDGVIDWSSCDVAREGASLTAKLDDERTLLQAELHWSLDERTGVLSSKATLCNRGPSVFQLQSAASLFVPLPSWASHVLSFDGDWSREGRPSRFVAPPGVWARINRTGRTGFGGSTFALLARNADDVSGMAMLIHLAWSGNHRLWVETLPSGQKVAAAGVELSPREVELAPGEIYATPTAYAAVSRSGLNGVSDAFHPFVRNQISPVKPAQVRKVHFNSWESSYFEFDEASLKDLATAAAAIGVERFVLDDGWFQGRRDDSSALGDWRVDPALFPNGLTPLIAHVHSLHMDFGLWVEPEMINPDSELYRNHPDWCVHARGASRPTMRHQLWLDVSRTDVRDYLFAQFDRLLAENKIAYLKWDCNRTLFPAVSGGSPAAHRIALGAYALMDRLQERHPHVEIESCASGGARIDLEMLKRASRVWPSDTTDALERLRIQRWASLILPLELIGAHVGPSPNPITGRRIDMDFRARVALFGHLGVELDPRTLDSSDRASLTAHIAAYKQHRALLHSGRHWRGTTADGAEIRLVSSHDKSEALLLAARAETSMQADSAAVIIPGLDPDACYRLTLLEPWPRLAKRRLAAPTAWSEGRSLTGAELAAVGLNLPLSDPQTAWLVHLARLSS